MEGTGSRRPILLLVAGSALGLVVAASGLLGTDPTLGGLPETAVARVNQSVITRDAYERLVAGLEADTRGPVDAEARRRVLDRLIEEELLVQRGLDLGLAENDRRVRADIAQAMIQSVVVEVEDEEVDRATLESFYRDEVGFFTRPGRMRLRQVFVRSARGDQQAPRARIERAAARLAEGVPFEEVADALGDTPVSPLPDALLPPAKVREYLGPTALRAASSLAAGQVSEPVRSGTGYHLLELLEREEAQALPFDEVADLVENEWRRRAGDRALRRYLDALRDEADVVVVEALP